MEIFDISQTLGEGIAVWPGDQDYRISWTMRIREGASCNVSAVTMSTHTGTHVDAPYHFDDQGPVISAVSLNPYLGPARVVEMPVQPCITAIDLERVDLGGVQRILFKTGASHTPEAGFDLQFVYLAENAADYLGQSGVLLVGTDAPSIDAFDSKTLASHRILLRHGVAVLEGVRLREVPAGDYELICLPLKLAGLDGSPVRAILRK